MRTTFVVGEGDLVRPRPRRSSVIVATTDEELADVAARVIGARSLELLRSRGAEELREVPPPTWRTVLALLLDVDVVGALDFVAVEQRYGGLIFDVTLMIVGSQPRESTELSPWAVSFVRPLSGPALLRAIDREIEFESYGSIVR